MLLNRRAFTLVEIMIVVSIVGMLVAMAMPSFMRARMRSQNARFAHDVQVAAAAFVSYSLETGAYPPDRNPGQMPQGMNEYLARVGWDQPTSLGGQWDWDYGQFGVTAGVSVYKPNADNDQMLLLDELFDDGSLNSGNFRSRSSGYIYVIEE